MQLKEEKWLAQVTNPNTGEFVQPEQLKAAGLVSNDYSNNKKYPIKTVYRFKGYKLPMEENGFCQGKCGEA